MENTKTVPTPPVPTSLEAAVLAGAKILFTVAKGGMLPTFAGFSTATDHSTMEAYLKCSGSTELKVLDALVSMPIPMYLALVASGCDYVPTASEVTKLVNSYNAINAEIFKR